METQKQFSTRTDQRWYAGFTAVIFLFLSLFCGGIMWLWLHMIGPALFVSGILLLCNIVFCLYLWKQKNIPLHFYGNQLLIFHLDGITYKIENVPARVFLFRQNALERKHNAGRIKIKGTQFYLYGVQDFDRTRRYIQENFPAF